MGNSASVCQPYYSPSALPMVSIQMSEYRVERHRSEHGLRWFENPGGFPSKSAIGREMDQGVSVNADSCSIPLWLVITVPSIGRPQDPAHGRLLPKQGPQRRVLIPHLFQRAPPLGRILFVGDNSAERVSTIEAQAGSAPSGGGGPSKCEGMRPHLCSGHSVPASTQGRVQFFHVLCTPVLPMCPHHPVRANHTHPLARCFPAPASPKTWGWPHPEVPDAINDCEPSLVPPLIALTLCAPRPFSDACSFPGCAYPGHRRLLNRAVPSARPSLSAPARPMEQNHMLQRPSVSRSRPGESSPEPWVADRRGDSESHSGGVNGIYGHQRPPYQSHDPASLQFPDAPTTDLPPIQPVSALAHDHGSALPSLSSVTGTQSFHPLPHLAESTNTSQPAPAPSWPAQPHRESLPPRPAESPAKMDVDTSSNSVASTASPDYFDGRASSVSLDDPDVRLAAEALGDLRAGMSTLLREMYASYCQKAVVLTLHARFLVLPAEFIQLSAGPLPIPQLDVVCATRWPARAADRAAAFSIDYIASASRHDNRRCRIGIQ